MAEKAWLGSKLRRLRRERHLAQAEVARRLGISPSYLNLIEHNQRPCTVALQMKVAEVLDVDPKAFSKDDEARLLADLLEVVGDPVFPSHDLDQDKLRDLIGNVPEAGKTILSLFRCYRLARSEVDSLAEKLSEDTYLSTSTHELRNLLASIRSFAEILHDNVDLQAEQRQKFHGIIVDQSERLTENINRMLAFAPGEGTRSLDSGVTPAEEVTDFVQEHRNHFPELEAAAAELGDALRFRGRDRLAALTDFLERSLGVEVREIAEPNGTAEPESLDAERGTLSLSQRLAPASRAFRMLRRIALLSYDQLFDELMDRAGLTGPAVREPAGLVLASYLAGAVLMPYDAFLDFAERHRHDIEHLQNAFDVGFEQVCHRLTTLQRPERSGVPFHFLRMDIAGNISKRFSASGLRIPRFGPACPRWQIHAAFMNHGQIQTQIMEFPDKSRYLTVSRSLTKPGSGWGDPPSHYAVALGCRGEFAKQLVYGDGLAPGLAVGAVPVGITCRLCERLECRQRAAMPLLTLSTSPDRTAKRPQPAARLTG